MTCEVSLDWLGKFRIKPRPKLNVSNLPIKSKNIFWFSNQFHVALAQIYVDTFLFPKHQQIPLLFFCEGEIREMLQVFF